jgi:hypothetical protein
MTFSSIGQAGLLQNFVHPALADSPGSDFGFYFFFVSCVLRGAA